jgi:cystathionine beta-lyase/cystathionine gamma-synthase
VADDTRRSRPGRSTRIAHAGEEPIRSFTEPLVAPIYQTTVYSYPGVDAVDDVYEGRQSGYIYSRYGMPNHRLLETALADLEGLEDGVATASGMSAITALLLGLLSAGDRIVASNQVYGGTRNLLDRDVTRFGVEVSYVDALDLDGVRRALKRPARMLYLEGITNPTLNVLDLPALAEIARQAGVLLAVDSTFATPIHCRPAEWGADVVIHSTTKFVGGHNDVAGGVVLGSASTIETVRAQAIRFGGVGGSFDAWLALRGLKTLAVRMRQSSANALALAESIRDHPAVERVRYPGLDRHPQHAVARRLLSEGFGSMVSIDLAGGRAAVDRVVANLSLIKFAETLGGLGTTVVHPATTSHRSVSAERRVELEIGDGLLRFSVGIEDPTDLIEEVRAALDQA